MAATAMIHVRMDEDDKAKAEDALRAMGFTVSDAVRIFLKRVVADQAIPFEVRVPNAETRAAMAEAAEIIRNRRVRFAGAQELFDDLEAGSR
jgi:DNA-damage-inducible protein J